jgi:PI31 proteasome regulator N-terminal
MSRASDSKVVHNFDTELAAHVLPDGWDSNLDRFTFMYKNKAKPGKQFMLTVIELKFEMSIRFFLRVGCRNDVSSDRTFFPRR